MRRRLRKQFAILAILAAFCGGIVALIVAIVYEPPPPPPPPPIAYADLVVSSTALFRSGSDRADLLAIVKNPNANAGVRKVPYTFEVRALDRVVGVVQGETFFLQGQEKPLAVINASVPTEGTDVSIRFGDPEWVPVGGEFRPPSLIVVSRLGGIRSGGEYATYAVKGVLANESELDFLTVEITALGLDDRGEVLGVGRTFIGSLVALERREFTVSWPLPPGRSIARTRGYPEVNIFSLSAIQPRPGSPTDLRSESFGNS